MAVDAGALAQIPLFADLDASDQEVLAGWLDAEQVDVGRRLTHQGASGYAFYIVRSASAEVTVEGDVVRTLGPGDFFGELAMLGQGRQTATVTVTVPGEVWIMFGTRFRELQQAYPAIAATVESAARQRRSNSSS